MTYRTVIIGAGQAGLALSRCLTGRGVEHVVLERGEVAESWRSRRWDSFRLLSPNYQTRLPSWAYRGRDPDGFMTGAEVVTFLSDYADSFHAPVRTGTTVGSVRPGPDGWRVETDRGVIDAENVVVATGDLDVPRIPAFAAALPSHVRQLHTADYRNPAQLPAGAVLVVGAGPSGQQIASELARSGRRVHLAVGRHKVLPRRYRGRDTYWWMERLGMLDRTRASLPAAHRRSPNAVLAGGERDMNVPRLAGEGVVVHGRLSAVDGATLRFADDLPVTLSAAEANADRFRAAVDAYVERTGMPCAPAPSPSPSPSVTPGPARLDLDDVGTVVWATGFGRDFSWLHAPVLDDEGEPVHERGVTAVDGLYFLGLRWQFRRSSSFLDGVGADAEHLAGVIAAHHAPAPLAAA